MSSALIVLKPFMRFRTGQIVACCLLVGLYCFALVQEHKTVAGDNLVAPRWHPMRKPTLWHKIRRTPTVLRCVSSCSEEEVKLRSRTATAANITSFPYYFRWISEDLAPWKAGITRKNLEQARETSAFRAVIHKGKLYTEIYYRCFQSRMMFTLWGILNLLDRFPGQVPDVEFVFNCQDRPQVKKQDYQPGEVPAPLFGYCGSDEHFDIPFPDFSFWGWPEVRIRPWKEELSAIVEASKHQPWLTKDPHAYWRGNPWTSDVRKQLLRCNSSSMAHIYAQDWIRQVDREDSKVSSQCDHQYNIYVEGYAWSASYKYILACGSPVLAIDGNFHEFFSRGLIPQKDVLPVQPGEQLCENIKAAVEWGNSHLDDAESMGLRARMFASESLNMDRVYDYMLQLFREYAKLQRFEPTILPAFQQRVCRNSVLCVANEAQRSMLLSSL